MVSHIPASSSHPQVSEDPATLFLISQAFIRFHWIHAIHSCALIIILSYQSIYLYLSKIKIFFQFFFNLKQISQIIYCDYSFPSNNSSQVLPTSSSIQIHISSPSIFSLFLSQTVSFFLKGNDLDSSLIGNVAVVFETQDIISSSLSVTYK